MDFKRLTVSGLYSLIIVPVFYLDWQFVNRRLNRDNRGALLLVAFHSLLLNDQVNCSYLHTGTVLGG